MPQQTPNIGLVTSEYGEDYINQNFETIDASLADIVTYNIKKFGAKGDGVTVNTTLIQNAINACRDAGGGTVLIPLGTFLTDTLKIYSNVTIKGVNKWNSILKLVDAPTGSLLDCSGVSNVTPNVNMVINNVYLTHKTGYSGTGQQGTLVNGKWTKYSELSDCVLSDFSVNALYLEGLSGDEVSMPGKTWNVSRNLFRNSIAGNSKGVFMKDAAEYVDIINNRMFVMQTGVYTENCANNKIIGNTMLYGNTGVHLQQYSDTINAGKNLVTGNTINHMGSYGIRIGAHGQNDNPSNISDNNLFLNYTYGIYLKGMYGGVVTGNKIVVGAGGTLGIRIEDDTPYKGDYNLITGNSISAGTISNAGTGTNNVITNNMENIPAR